MTAIIVNTDIKPLTLGISTKLKSICIPIKILDAEQYNLSYIVTWSSLVVGNIYRWSIFIN